MMLELISNIILLIKKHVITFTTTNYRFSNLEIQQQVEQQQLRGIDNKIAT